MHISNPILPGAYSDPSICKGPDGYYLICSTFEFLPGIPVFYSKDMRSWRQVGNVLADGAGLPFADVQSCGGIFAPALRHHDGLFYMITTFVGHGFSSTLFYMTAENAAGPWSAVKKLPMQSIDPSLYFEDGRAYVQFLHDFGDNGGKNSVAQVQVDLAAGRPVGEVRKLWDGSGGRYPEGPHLYKKDGWYYLMIAEGGTEAGHMVTVARSQSLWGPFGGCPGNPIVTNRDQNSPYLAGAGHGDLVEDDAGHWWMALHGYRPVGLHHHLGRETCLAPVEWSDGGWPLVPGGRLEREIDLPRRTGGAVTVEYPLQDDFSAPALHPSWVGVRENPASHVDLLGPGLVLKLSAAGLHEAAAPGLLMKRQRELVCEYETELAFEPACETEQAGMVLYENERFHVSLSVRLVEGARMLVLEKRLSELVWSEPVAKPPEGPLRLRVQADPQRYYFYYAGPGEADWLPAGSVETRFLSTELIGYCCGVHVGLYATGAQHAGNGRACFSYFKESPRRA